MVHQIDLHGALGVRLLDNPVWAAGLDGPHAGFAERVGRAARCPANVYAFAALADPADPAAWADLHTLLGPATTARLKGVETVPDILDLVARTGPGPFARTVHLGTYLGIRHRHRGLGTRLVRAVAAGIRERGETPFLHAAANNATAIRLYESMGFTLRRRTAILQVRSPGTDPRTGAL
ncbi:GNAT family N-acetyltransferase [Streptomyces sp. S.PB5]|uniref:GNAT family N-acetyltransferase n=1 Tax=Streptomyces sp. S.PB5 TaxID=3020844 RepID=UPI0025B01F85|nr:GNAT family N-acetyltransferase [Streptomyces sp. S.PB5]MDN3025582.1 GNAT family N-acetyltransferase [Streptomyces sp. S.PB5]